MKDKTLILGAAGFIGTNLAERLYKERKKLILFDKEGAQYPKTVLAAEGIVLAAGSFTECTGSDWRESFPYLENVETVYHLISTTCPTNSNINMAQEMEENLISTIHFLDACVGAGVLKVIFLSSGGGTVYGKEHKGICREEACPITAYGVQKLGIEKILYLY